MSQQQNKSGNNVTVGYVKNNKSGNGKHIAITKDLAPGRYILKDPYSDIQDQVSRGRISEEVGEERMAKLRSTNVFQTIVKIEETK